MTTHSTHKMFRSLHNLAEHRLKPIFDDSKPCDNHAVHHDKCRNKYLRRWHCVVYTSRKPHKNELIDLRGQNETKYNRISFLVLLRLTFVKGTENKSEELECKNQSESNKSNYFFPVRRNSITAAER